MDELYPTVRIELLMCQHRDGVGRQCVRAPSGSLLLSPSGHVRNGPYCDEHLRERVLELEGKRIATDLLMCSATTVKGEQCSAVPAHLYDGEYLCSAHYRKMRLGQEAAE